MTDTFIATINRHAERFSPTSFTDLDHLADVFERMAGDIRRLATLQSQDCVALPDDKARLCRGLPRRYDVDGPVLRRASTLCTRGLYPRTALRWGRNRLGVVLPWLGSISRHNRYRPLCERMASPSWKGNGPGLWRSWRG